MGGGGDGGAQAEADRVRVEESQRDRRIAQDKAKINALFGITDYDYNAVPGALYKPQGSGAGDASGYQTQYQGEVDRLQQLIDSGQGTEGGTPGVSDADGFTDYTTNTWDDLAKAKANLAGVTNVLGDNDAAGLESQAGVNFDAREATLEGIYKDILGKYTSEQDRQYDRKASDIKAMLSSRGLSRGTVGQSIFDRLSEIRDTNTTGFEEGASDAISRIRDSDTEIKANLISQLDAGESYGNVESTALSKRTSNIDNSVSQANARNLTELFKGMDELYGQKQYVDAYNSGQQRGSTNIVTPGGGSSSSGSVLNY